MSDRNKSTREAQARTLVHADAWGQPWGGDEIEMVKAFKDATAEELAEALGRTVYAVHGARERLLQGLPIGGGVDRKAKLERAYTFIGDDCPPGWND